MKIKGWKKIFKFTYIQNIKGKSFIGSTVAITVIFMLIMLGINFLPGLFSDDISTESTAEEFNVKKIYMLDESGISPLTDFSVFNQFGVETETITKDKLSETANKIYSSSSAEILIHITRTEDGNYFDIVASRPLSEEKIGSGDCNEILSAVSGILNASNLISLGVSPEDVVSANSGISTHVTIAGEEPKSEIAQVVSFIIPVLSSVLLFVFIFSYGALVAQSIATEKTSRVMELLLTSVKPLAVIIGKVIAMGLVSLTQLFILLAATAATTFVTAPFGIIGQLFGMAQTSDVEMQAIGREIGEAFADFNIGSVIWIAVVFVLGFLFYALIAGLIGATVSRAEDLQSAMQPLSLIAVFGFYIAYMPMMFSADGGEKNIISWIALYLPISSPFVLPSSILLGELSLAQTFLAVGVLAAFDVLMVLLVAKVYEGIILHTGDRLKLGAILKLAKEK